jgi:hypothetical protein
VLHGANGSQQELDFEAEEAAILDAAQRLPLRLDQLVHHAQAACSSITRSTKDRN